MWDCVVAELLKRVWFACGPHVGAGGGGVVEVAEVRFFIRRPRVGGSILASTRTGPPRVWVSPYITVSPPMPNEAVENVTCPVARTVNTLFDNCM